jgi:hypothetical protein
VYQVVHDHYETFRAEAVARRDGEPLPRFIDQEFRGFLRCGQLAGRVRQVPSPGSRVVPLHAGVLVPGQDRARLERVCRYALRPPLAADRVQRAEDGDIILALRHSDARDAHCNSESSLAPARRRGGDTGACRVGFARARDRLRKVLALDEAHRDPGTVAGHACPENRGDS